MLDRITRRKVCGIWGSSASTYSTEKHPPDPAHAPVSAEFAALVRPAGNGRGPMGQLARFYDMLRNHGTLDRARMISPQTVEAMTARHRVGMLDHTFKHVIDFGLGFLINSALRRRHRALWLRTLCKAAHFWPQWESKLLRFCDPEIGLVAAWVCNGTPGEPRHQQRHSTINDAIYEDLQWLAIPMSQARRACAWLGSSCRVNSNC